MPSMRRDHTPGGRSLRSPLGVEPRHERASNHEITEVPAVKRRFSQDPEQLALLSAPPSASENPP